MNRAKVIARAFGLVLLATGGFGWRPVTAQKQPPAPTAGMQSQSSDPALIDAEGYKELLARHRGKVLLVDFWATWCEPCRDEYPMVNELAKKYAPQGLVVFGVSLDEDAEMGLVRSFLRRHQPVFLNVRKKPGPDEPFINSVNPQWRGTIPAAFFYGRDGRQFKFLVGEHTREELEKTIQELLRARSGAP